MRLRDRGTVFQTNFGSFSKSSEAEAKENVEDNLDLRRSHFTLSLLRWAAFWRRFGGALSKTLNLKLNFDALRFAVWVGELSCSVRVKASSVHLTVEGGQPNCATTLFQAEIRCWGNQSGQSVFWFSSEPKSLFGDLRQIGVFWWGILRRRKTHLFKGAL